MSIRTAVHAPAKVNLFLSVGAAGPDGYHDVTTVMQALELGDTVSLAEAPALAVTCEPDLGIPAERNLAHRAAEAFAAACGREPLVSIAVEKAVPHGAGLGGGSSDAAAVIRGLAHLWGIAPSDPRLTETAAAIGADVPFFLGPPCALLGGRGDALIRTIDAPVFDVVVVWPGESVSTADAYRAFDDLPRPSPCNPDALVAALGRGDVPGIAAHLHNSMTAASVGLAGDIAAALGHLAACEGILGSAMCGSGSAVFGIAASSAAAGRCAAAARERGWWATATRSLAGDDRSSSRTAGGAPEA